MTNNQVHSCGSILFSQTRPGVFVAKIGRHAVTLDGEGLEYAEQVDYDHVPCEYVDGCPEKRTPESIDVCKQTCPFKEPGEACARLIYHGGVRRNAIAIFRRTALKADSKQVSVQVAPELERFVYTDWMVDGQVFKA